MLEIIEKVIKENYFDNIYQTGIAVEDNGVYEFIAHDIFLYFEFGPQFIEFESINSYEKFKISLVDSIKYILEFDDAVACNNRVSNLIFKSTLTNNKIKRICFYDLETSENALYCNGVYIELVNEQEIFIDPTYLGINIGGMEVKQIWEDNLPEGKGASEKFIDFIKE